MRACSHVLAFPQEDLGPLLQPDRAAQLQTAMQRLRQMETMLRELRDFAKLGQGSPPREAIDVEKLLAQLISLLAPPSAFEVELPRPLPVIENAPVLVSLVFRNLIGNAINHHHRHKGRIVSRGETRDGRAEFFVSDDGPGIDPAMHRLVFEPFKKLDPNGSGTGMGLAFVERAVDRAQGTVDIVASGPGRGTTLRVVFLVTTAESPLSERTADLAGVG